MAFVSTNGTNDTNGTNGTKDTNCTNGFCEHENRTLASLIPWEVPHWVPKSIPNRPTHKANLIANLTPIQPWHISALSDKYEFYIKRDDLTGVALTGNKVRKLEFTLSEAIQTGCDTIIVYGSPFSNHCRATAVSCAQLGLDCHVLLLYRYDENASHPAYAGNLAIMSAAGAKLYRADKNLIQPGLNFDKASFEKVNGIMDNLSLKLSKEGKRPFIILKGGSKPAAGIWGYMNCWNEMMQQKYFSEITDVVVTSCTGGTTLDLALANLWTGSKKRIHSIRNWGWASDFYEQAEEILEESGITGINLKEIVNVIDGHAGKCYGDTWPELRSFSLAVAAESGIFLDPVYTGKTLLGLKKELEINPAQFQGNKLLFMHTGGFVGFLDGEMEEAFRETNPIVDIESVLPNPH